MPLTDHDVLLGGDVTPRTGRMRSLAELLQALREAEARVGTAPGSPTVPAPAVTPVPARPALVATPAAAPAADRAPRLMAATQQPVTLSLTAPADAPDRVDVDAGSLRPPAGVNWLAVVAAHAGVGASTAALSVADAAATAGRQVHLVSSAPPSRCGLVAVPAVELGVDDSGAWRRGRRSNQLIIDRSSGEHREAARWPALPFDPDLTVVDAWDPDRLTDAGLAAPAERPSAVLLVCRATVPGLQQAERTLSALALGIGPVPVLLAMLGPRRTPGPVQSATGPLLREARAAGRVIAVPLDRRLALTGPSSGPLPRPVAAAGRTLLRHLDALGPHDRSAPTQSAPGKLLTKEPTS